LTLNKVLGIKIYQALVVVYFWSSVKFLDHYMLINVIIDNKKVFH